MKRSLMVVALALLACASQQKTTPTAAPQGQDERASVIRPSQLSPEQIRLLQRSLIDRGFAVDLSGTFDHATQTALADFQRARGLPGTGNLNAPTVGALGLDPRDVTPVRGNADSAPQPAPSGTPRVPQSEPSDGAAKMPASSY